MLITRLLHLHHAATSYYTPVTLHADTTHEHATKAHHETPVLHHDATTHEARAAAHHITSVIHHNVTIGHKVIEKVEEHCVDRELKRRTLEGLFNYEHHAKPEELRQKINEDLTSLGNWIDYKIPLHYFCKGTYCIANEHDIENI